MVTGMGMVFLFLVTMIFWMKLSSVFAARFSHLLPEEVIAPKRAVRAAATGSATVPGGVAPTLLAAITAAVHQHRSKHDKQL